METTYSRSQVASVASTRDWNVGFLLLAVVFGSLVGLGFGLKDQLLRRGLGQDESYLVLSSALYGLDPTPATAATVRQNLVALDFPSPSLTVLKLADRFSQSRDKERQRDAESLRLLGEALNSAIAPAALASVVPTPAAVAQQSDLVVSAPALPTATALPQASPASTTPSARAAAATSDSSPTPTPQGSATAAAGPAAPTATAPAAPTVRPTSAAESGSATATVRSNDGRTLVLRRDASSKSAKIVSMPDGSKVQIVRQVIGEAVEGQDARWYLVKYKDLTGYAYAKYIAPAN